MKARRKKYIGSIWKAIDVDGRPIDMIFDWNTSTFIAVRDRLHMIVRALKLMRKKGMRCMEG